MDEGFSIAEFFILYFFQKLFENIKKGYNFAAPKVKQAGFHGCVEMLTGGVPEWPNGADCKSAGVRLRWFESIRPHSLCHNYSLFLPVKERQNKCGSSSAGRAIAFQAIGREFEPRLPLNFLRHRQRPAKTFTLIIFRWSLLAVTRDFAVVAQG